MKRKSIVSRLGASALVAASLATAASAANVTLTADDGFGTSSFNAAGTWSNAAPPAAGNQYDNASFLLRTPADGNSYTFGGDALTITSTAALGADLNDALMYKGTATSTLTVNNLTFNGGALRHGNNENQIFTLAGNALTVGASGMAVHVQGPLTVTSPVSGSGPIRIMADGSDDARRVFELASPSNTYTGSIELTNPTQARFHLAGTSVLDFVIGASGTSNRIFGSGGVVALDGKFNFDLAAAGTTPGDTWQIVDNATLTETFGPSFAVNGFTDNGDDTWSTQANGATYTFSESTGALTASPVPEPTALTLLALAPLALTRRRRRQPD
jgi:hypothetical protein